MIARFRCTLPSPLALRRSDQLPPVEAIWEGVRCRVFPPFQLRRGDGGAIDLSGEPADPPALIDMTIDGEHTFIADAIEVELQGEFDRRQNGNADDVKRLAFALLQTVFARLRCLGRAFFMKFDAQGVSWRLRYLSDSGEEFPPQEGFVRGRGAASISVPSFMWIAPEHWAALGTIATGSPAPPSDELWLDALDALPHIGAAVVLAYTAIEVRVASALNVLATNTPAVVGREMWAWINDREQFLKEPSVEEQLTDLMQLLAGKSLRKEKQLWMGTATFERRETASRTRARRSSWTRRRSHQ